MKKLVFLGLIVALIASLSIYKFGAGGFRDDGNGFSSAEGNVEQVTKLWVSNTTMAYVLREMIDRDESGSVMENFQAYSEQIKEGAESEGYPHFDGVEILREAGVISEHYDGYRVIVDTSKWNQDSDYKFESSEIRQAMMDALEVNEVGWCGRPVSGYEFASSYEEKYWGSFDAKEEYLASIENYVKCGSVEVDKGGS